jgi:kinesin family protein 2/24
MKGNNPALQKKGSVVDNIRKMEQQREERRKKFEEAKIVKADRAAANAAAGKNLDIEFDLMIQNAKGKAKQAL